MRTREQLAGDVVRVCNKIEQQLAGEATLVVVLALASMTAEQLAEHVDAPRPQCINDAIGILFAFTQGALGGVVAGVPAGRNALPRGN